LPLPASSFGDRYLQQEIVCCGPVRHDGPGGGIAGTEVEWNRRLGAVLIQNLEAHGRHALDVRAWRQGRQEMLAPRNEGVISGRPHLVLTCGQGRLLPNISRPLPMLSTI